MLEPSNIQTELFEQPSGNVRGIVVALGTFKGKTKRIAHATLLTDMPPAVVLDIPKKMSVTELPALAAILQAFAAQVAEADTPASGKIAKP